MSPVAEQTAYSEDEIRSIGKIPIRNLWLLMLYASDLYRQLDVAKISVEDNPEDIADLVAEILCRWVEHRLVRNLSFGYEKKVEIIGRVRGRIDVLSTERHRLLDKGKVCCRFEALSVDTPRNRYVRAALEQLGKLLSGAGLARRRKSADLARRCKTLAMRLDRLGVSKGRPLGYNGKSERFGHHDAEDRKMIAAADLAFTLELPTEFIGQHYLALPDREEIRLWELFEKAIAGFYSVTLEKAQWRVLPGTSFKFQITGSPSGIDAILPSMKTDIIVEQRNTKTQLVIDTKFKSVTTKGQYQERILRSGDIYQMYTYLRSQEDPSIAHTLSSMGMLLHPTVDEEFNESVTIQGHPIWFCTVNLGGTASSIRERLLLLHQLAFG